MNMGRACRVLAAFVLLGGACRAADDRVFVSPSGGGVADLAAYPSYGGPERMRYFAEASEAEKQNHTVLHYDPNDHSPNS